MCTSHVRELIVGSRRKSTTSGNRDAIQFDGLVYESFITMMIQSFIDMTTNIGTYIQLGRSLYIQYCIPCSTPQCVSSLISTLLLNRQKSQLLDATADAKHQPQEQEYLQSAIISHLNQKSFRYFKIALTESFGTLPFDSPGCTTISNNNTSDIGLPILLKYLLLASYICQTNHPDNDQKFFVIEKKGKKQRRRRSTENANDEEVVAYGSTKQQRPPRTFPLERLYSLYVTIATLNSTTATAVGTSTNTDDGATLHSSCLVHCLGNTMFLQSISELQTMEILHEYIPSSSAYNSNRRRIMFCTLSQNNAMKIANTIDFPLDRYCVSMS